MSGFQLLDKQLDVCGDDFFRGLGLGCGGKGGDVAGSGVGGGCVLGGVAAHGEGSWVLNRSVVGVSHSRLGPGPRLRGVASAMLCGKVPCKGSPGGTGGSEYLELPELFPTACARVGAGLPSRSGFLALAQHDCAEIAFGDSPRFTQVSWSWKWRSYAKHGKRMKPFPTLRTAAWKTRMKLASSTFPRPRRRD